MKSTKIIFRINKTSGDISSDSTLDVWLDDKELGFLESPEALMKIGLIKMLVTIKKIK